MAALIPRFVRDPSSFHLSLLLSKSYGSKVLTQAAVSTIRHTSSKTWERRRLGGLECKCFLSGKESSQKLPPTWYFLLYPISQKFITQTHLAAGEAKKCNLFLHSHRFRQMSITEEGGKLNIGVICCLSHRIKEHYIFLRELYKLPCYVLKKLLAVG